LLWKTTHISSAEDRGPQEVPARPSRVNRSTGSDRATRSELRTDRPSAAHRHSVVVSLGLDRL
jgi:hypothetical protein